MTKKYDYTAKNIANIVEKFKKLLEKHDCQDDVCIYYCGHRDKYISRVYDKVRNEYAEANRWSYDCMCHPTQYCEYAPSKNIISFSSEGTLSGLMYSGTPKWLEDFALKFGMYIECATSWFFYFAPCNNWSDYETDDTEEVKNYPIPLFCPEDYDNEKVPILKTIAQVWEDLCKMADDKGCCAMGYGMIFRYEGQKYKMIPRSDKQGEWSWEQWVDKIKNYLSMVGCTEIYWDYGHMD